MYIVFLRSFQIQINNLGEKIQQQRIYKMFRHFKKLVITVLLTLFIPARRFRSAQQKLLPAIMERLTAVIYPSRSFNIFLSCCFSKKNILNWALIHRFQPKCAKTVVALPARNIWYNSASHVIDFYYMCYCISF